VTTIAKPNAANAAPLANPRNRNVISRVTPSHPLQFDDFVRVAL
jgi:hypothetical protein